MVFLTAQLLQHLVVTGDVSVGHGVVMSRVGSGCVLDSRLAPSSHKQDEARQEAREKETKARAMFQKLQVVVACLN